ncbi:hypothetical protein SAMN04489812_1038 [Microlunatus soli]|uniref:Uncharacterized protein n=1 Tax=Microlunatus soli TaxID=630515 RepID=A0A1H1PVB2_9ACTN|nr:hypothetical protein SAMN04489812_1038 [Microlunatus soli]
MSRQSPRIDQVAARKSEWPRKNEWPCKNERQGVSST